MTDRALLAMSRRNLLLALGAATTLPAPAATPPGRVVASFSILADMAREIAPAGVEVTSLVRPDADAHVFEPTPADARRLAQADLVLVNGLGFEGWIERLIKVSGYRGTTVVATQGIATRQVGGSADPHAWQDLGLAQGYVGNLSRALAARWPEAAAEVEARTADYRARLAALDTQVRQWLGAVPREKRRVITSHDAFGYFGNAYGVDFLAPQGWTTRSEPSAATVARLLRQVREQDVQALFVENISDPRLVERIARETGARVGGTLYSDALSAAGGPADTYLRMFAHNARSLAEALSKTR
ncbi:MAG: metal ABC transporter substrate-binding protein [Methylibium sp. NZG]|nr:MAG: metal ABC transporter substrate-binding protein [Methylibium sp. NZG]